MSADKSPILKIRTFADDLRRAEGGEAGTPIVPLQSAGSAAVTVAPQAVIEINTAPEPAPHIAPLREATPTAFNINDEIQQNAQEAMIVNEHPIRRRSLFSDIGNGLSGWWQSSVLPLFSNTNKEILSGTASFQSTPTEPVARTFASDKAETTQKFFKNVTEPSWQRISEPRENTPLPHTSKEELIEYKSALQSALPTTPTPSVIKMPLKEARSTRPANPETGNVIAKDMAFSVAPDDTARARLERLTETHAPEEHRNRDIPFIPPTPLETPTAPLRTYRNDALTDIQSRELSKPQIAAEERTRRDATGVPLRALPRHHSLIPRFVGGAVLILCLCLVGGYAYIHFGQNSSVTPSTAVTSSLFFKTERERTIPLPATRIALLEALSAERANAILGNNETLGIHLVSQDQDARAEEVLTLLDPKAPSSFLHTLKDYVMFGSAGEEKAPFIIFKVVNFDIAFAGILKWEEYISIDLAPFFGAPVRRTYDGNALTSDHARPAYFSDQTIQGHDVRILYDEVGRERLLYTFINQDTLLITTSHTALLSLIDHLE